LCDKLRIHVIIVALVITHFARRFCEAGKVALVVELLLALLLLLLLLLLLQLLLWAGQSVADLTLYGVTYGSHKALFQHILPAALTRDRRPARHVAPGASCAAHCRRPCTAASAAVTGRLGRRACRALHRSYHSFRELFALPTLSRIEQCSSPGDRWVLALLAALTAITNVGLLLLSYRPRRDMRWASSVLPNDAQQCCRRRRRRGCPRGSYWSETGGALVSGGG